ncbi:MAG: hypothetical protein J2P20_09905 [Pseudonocardia sp.]|nr:hypothetical protein [Pseudonocardia sp.]
MDTGPYLLILIIGVLIVVIDGQLIIRNSPSYLRGTYQDARQARRVSGLVAVFFHLVMFGLVALVASIGLPPDAGARSVIARIGVLLLLTAAGHLLAIVALSRLREQQSSTELASAQLEAHRQQVPRRGARMERGTARPAPASDPVAQDGAHAPADAPET